MADYGPNLAQRRAALQARARTEMAAGMRAAVADANSKTAGMVIEMARIMGEGIAAREFSRAHETIAKAAQQSILSSYDQTVTRMKGPAGRIPYRADDAGRNRRYAGGLLRAALKSPGMISWDAEGFGLINADMLDREAAHWYRLNAGAAPRGRGSRHQYQVRFSNLVVASIGLNMPPSKPFFMPRGMWINASEGRVPGNPARRGEDMFYPAAKVTSAPPKKPKKTHRGKPEGPSINSHYRARNYTKGIEARNFLDAGVDKASDLLGPTYLRVYKQAWDQRVVKIRPSTVKVRRFRS